jgi:5-methylcytosine-specific restriction endonuclease McrA
MSETHRVGSVKFDSNRQSARSLADLYKKGLLNLHPVFQRQSVWRGKQREHLIDSLFQGYPIPAIFLYKHIDDRSGAMIFEVVDGKQRLETLFMFMGVIRGMFSVSLQLQDSAQPQRVNWPLLRKKKQQSRIEEYQLQVIQVEADLSDIIELFVRINSTGNALTRQEIRSAHFYQSPFLKTAKRLATRNESYLQRIGTIGAQQARRMKHIELLSELIYSAHIEGVANKKRVLDSAMNNDSGLKGAQLQRAERATTASLNRLRRMYPDLSKTVRFHKLSDFYSLAVVIQDLERRGFVLDDRKRNRLAWDVLVTLSVGVDELAIRSRRLDFKSLSPREDLFRQYLQAVREGSDTETNRRKRHEILLGLIEPIFERKDAKRAFSPEQRRVLWNSADERVCKECGLQLTWADFQADHIKPFAAGGKTDLENAAILCAQHNKRKGKKLRLRAA